MTDASNDPWMAELGQVIDDAPVVIYLKDAAGRYLYVNKQYEAVTGIPPESVIGHTDFDLFPQPVADAYRKDDLQALDGPAPVRFEEAAYVNGNERLYSATKFAVPRNGTTAILAISVDITDEAQEAADAAAGQTKADAFFGRLLDSLTPQEVRVLDLVAAGLSDREIAKELDLSGDTVRHHVSHLLKKLRKRRAHVIIEMLKRDRA